VLYVVPWQVFRIRRHYNPCRRLLTEETDHGLNSDLSRPVPSFSIIIGEPHCVQNRRCIGAPLCPPGIVKVVIVPVIITASEGKAMADKNAVPVCF
jgi:hypothetical protein